MQLRIRMRPAGTIARLPVQYNALVQGFIYRHLDDYLAESIHGEGIVDGKRHLRMFTFSRLMARGQVASGMIGFTGQVSLVVASPMAAFLESFALHVVRAGTVQLGPATFAIESLEVERDVPYQVPVVVRALSPVTAYSTLLTPTGGRKTYYFSPFEREFSDLVVRNLARKARAWTGEDVPVAGSSIRPYRIGVRDQRILVYRDTIIKGWLGLYELRVPEPLFRMAMDAGLGSKNSQGFGCVQLYRPADGRPPRGSQPS